MVYPYRLFSLFYYFGYNKKTKKGTAWPIIYIGLGGGQKGGDGERWNSGIIDFSGGEDCYTDRDGKYQLMTKDGVEATHQVPDHIKKLRLEKEAARKRDQKRMKKRK